MNSNSIPMNKRTVITKIQYFQNHFGDCIAMAGCALVIMGLREQTTDIDLAIPQKLFDSLALTNEVIQLKNPDILKIDMMDVYDVSNNGYDEYSKNFVLMDGIKIQSPEAILELKKRLNRPKDQLDIQKLEQYIKFKDKVSIR